MVLKFDEEYMDCICFIIMDKRRNRPIGELEIMEFSDSYDIVCRANDDFNQLYKTDIDTRLTNFFEEIKAAILTGLFGLDLDKPVHLVADEKIASRYAIVNCLERIPRFDGYYFL